MFHLSHQRLLLHEWDVENGCLPSTLPKGCTAVNTPHYLLLCRWDAENDSSTPSTPSVSTPNRLRPLSSALEGSLASASSSEDIPSAQDLQPSANPSALLQTVLQQLQQANGAKRKELDWQMQNQACSMSCKFEQPLEKH